MRAGETVKTGCGRKQQQRLSVDIQLELVCHPPCSAGGARPSTV